MDSKRGHEDIHYCVFGRIILEEEEELLPRLLLVAEERAKNLLDLVLNAGTTHILGFPKMDW